MSSFAASLAFDRPRACRYAARLLGSAAQAEDVVQETCLRVVQAAHAGGTPPAHDGYFWRTLTHLCIDELRRRPRAPAALEDADAVATHAAFAGDPAVAADERDAARAALAELERLPPAQRVAVVLRLWEDLEYAAIADRLGTTATNAATLVWRALKTLRERLVRRPT